jgi:hypothetical protein
MKIKSQVCSCSRERRWVGEGRKGINQVITLSAHRAEARLQRPCTAGGSGVGASVWCHELVLEVSKWLEAGLLLQIGQSVMPGDSQPHVDMGGQKDSHSRLRGRTGARIQLRHEVREEAPFKLHNW